MRKLVIGFYRKCDFLTMSSVAMAFFGIILAITGHFNLAVTLLMICGICDAFDGNLARRYKYSEEQKTYGVQLDSLADVFCFGAFPAILTSLISPHVITYVISALYLLCGVIRLAYFNMRAIMDEKNSKVYIGVPITIISISYSIIFIITSLINLKLLAFVMPVVLILQGFLFIAYIEIKKYDFTKIIKKVFNEYVINFLVLPFVFLVLGNLFFALNFVNPLGVFRIIGNNIFSTTYTLIWIISIYLILLSILGNTKRSKIGLLIISLLFLIVNDVKFKIMGVPVELSDVAYLNPDSAEQLGIATTTIGTWIFSTIFKSIVYIVIGIIMIKFDYIHKIEIKSVLKKIITLLLSILVFIIPLLGITKINTFILTKIYGVTHSEVTSYIKTVDMYKHYGFYQGLLFDHASLTALKPENYNDAKVKELLNNNYSSGIKYPKANVVFILNEAFTDMQTITDVKFNKSLTTNIDNLKKLDNAAVIDTLVTAFGGTSVNTEFQILTGASLNFWKPDFLPFNQYYNNSNLEKTPSIMKEFNNNGYKSYYITPWGEHSYHSKYVYTGLGASETIYGKDLKGDIKGRYYSDESLVNDIYNTLASEDGTYKFIMSATGENHFPYEANKFDKYDIDVISSPYNSEDTNMLLSYAQGEYDADRALGILYEKIQTLKTPTIVIAFGDHYPYIVNSKGESVYLKSPYLNTNNRYLNEVRKHTTLTVMYSNFDIDLSDANYMNISYLGAYILNKFDLNISPYFKYINNLRNTLPVFDREVYLENGNFNSIENASKEIKDSINNYRDIQYYNFYGAIK